MLLTTICIVAAAVSLQAQEDVTDAVAYIGYIPYDKVLQQMPEYATAQQSYDQLREKYDAEAKRAEDEFQRKFSDFLQGQKDFPRSIMQKRQTELQELMDTACDMIADPEKYQDICKRKKLATLFFEPSTRTRLSFEAAMYELGGNVISVSSAGASSAAKGESVADTAKTVSCYADIIAMRHPKEGAAFVAAKAATVPVINAGDGGHNHPTQTLADLLTIYREKGRMSGLTIGLCGDLKFGRTVHSLINAMSRYDDIKFYLISPEELKVPSYVKKDVLQRRRIPYTQTTDLESAMPDLDILYMTRVQRERFFNEEDYLRLKDSYILTPEKLRNAKGSLSILHPLPRVNEISVTIDSDPRACYFKQVLNGKYMRMALIVKLLKEAGTI